MGIAEGRIWLALSVDGREEETSGSASGIYACLKGTNNITVKGDVWWQQGNKAVVWGSNCDKAMW
jgi:hypothetical protein